MVVNHSKLRLRQLYTTPPSPQHRLYFCNNFKISHAVHVKIFGFTATTALASSTVRKDDEKNQEQTTKGDVGSHEEDDIDPTLVDDEGHRIKRGFLKGGGGSYAPPIITHYGPPPGAAAAAQAAHAAHQAQYAAQAAQQVIK